MKNRQINTEYLPFLVEWNLVLAAVEELRN
jgi:hypothetical protein